ncbi:alpha-(1,6)-fucosyltransferase-like [Ciona intestinalis]
MKIHRDPPRHVRNTKLSSNQDDTGDDQQVLVDRFFAARRVKTGIVELWRAIQSEILNFSGGTKKAKVLGKLKERYNALLIDMDELLSFDDQWRSELAKQATNEVAETISRLQNPEDCNGSRLSSGMIECGFGCAMHSLVGRFDHAIAQNRRFIINGSQSDYSNGLDVIKENFKPISSCPKENTDLVYVNSVCDMEGCDLLNKTKEHSSNIRDYKYVHVSEITSFHMGAFKPLGASKQLWTKIVNFHGNPTAWWKGQLLRYIMRPNEAIERMLEEERAQIDFGEPIVGVHVRRTDKLFLPGENAKFHYFREYMKHVDDWYDRYELQMRKLGAKHNIHRRVYLATDDVFVWEKEVKSYSSYTFLGTREFSITAGSSRSSRTSENGLRSIITDITMLSNCNFLVCTFTSEVCNAAYELKQTYSVDASDDAVSLDSMYGVVGLPNKLLKAVYDHTEDKATSNMEFKPGDDVFILKNLWNGTYDGWNGRTGNAGIFPSYKVQYEGKYCSKQTKLFRKTFITVD